MERQEVFTLIDEERQYQEGIGCPQVSLEGELLLLGDYVDRARRAYAENFGDETETKARDIVRKIAAIAVRCIENYGAPPRPKPVPKGEERIPQPSSDLVWTTDQFGNPMRHPSSIPDD